MSSLTIISAFLNSFLQSQNHFLYPIRDIRQIRESIDRSTVCTIATSLDYSKVDYCNFLFLNLPFSLINRLQLILNAAACVVTKTAKLHHIAQILKRLTSKKKIMPVERFTNIKHPNNMLKCFKTDLLLGSTNACD